MAQFTGKAKEQEEQEIQSVFYGPVKPVVYQFDQSSATDTPNVCWYEVLDWTSRGGKSSCCKNLSDITALRFRVKELRGMCQCKKGRKGGLKRAEEWQVISDVNRGEWDGNRKERARGEVGIVKIVKTSDDSLCPLYGDCSLINLAAEIFPLWAKMRIGFPLSSSSSLTFLDVGKIKWTDSFKVWYKRDSIDTPSPQKIKSALLPPFTHTLSIPLSASCLIKISPLTTLLTTCLSF